jgi:DNA mismatch endonuclease (patch repair protein)
MRGNTSTGTVAEARLERAMQARGLNDYVTNASDLPGSPDFVFPTQKLAVFVHGCFWHRCPYCRPHFPESNVEYWSAKFQRNRYRDARNRSDLRSMGWQPIVVWECTVLKDPTRVAARLKRRLEATLG